MLATLVTAVVEGLRGALVRVEVDIAPGLPVCHIVGLPDAALSEARERVRSAIRNSGFEYPMSRITVNLAPADQRKRGAAYDLAIAMGILVASGQVERGRDPWALLGELSLGGRVQAVKGVLPMTATLVRAGFPHLVVPASNLDEARLVEMADAHGAETLADAIRLIGDGRGRRRRRVVQPPPVDVSGSEDGPAARSRRTSRLVASLDAVDLAEVRGQAYARWALQVALVGQHNLLLVGPPGSGKTLLARTIPGLLPPLSDAESLEVTVIESVAGLMDHAGLRRDRPVRAPHHTISYAALVGGGSTAIPGEVTLAHRGILFLDELAEFDRQVLDALRQPLEDGVITIGRVRGHVQYPARIQLIAAMNPCRCGHFGDRDRPCQCGPGEPERYVRRVSGPLLDRIDLRVEVPRIDAAELLGPDETESTTVVAPRIAQARARGLERNRGVSNAGLSGAEALRVAALEPADRTMLAELAAQMGMTARGVHRVVRIARSIADLHGAERVERDALLAAASLRGADEQHRSALAS